MTYEKLEELKEQVYRADLGEEDKNRLMNNILNLQSTELNILIVGGTGVGKSSTINALFNLNDMQGEHAKVGVSNEPQTMDIQKYEVRNLILWDSPGLGDSIEKDERHKKLIIEKLKEVDENNKALIDLVLVLIDASSRDLSSAYNLINNIIIPNMEDKSRILIAANKCDNISGKPNRYDYAKNKPTAKGIEENEELINIIRKRIKESSNVDIEPIYYSAGYKEDGEEQMPPYNLSKLLYCITKAIPAKKRYVLSDKISQVEDNFIHSDNKIDYMEESTKSWFDSITEFISFGITRVDKAKQWFVENKDTLFRVWEVGKNILDWIKKDKAPKTPMR